jgi:hypothetical protein
MTDPSGSQQQWLRERGFLNARRHELARAAQDLYPRSWRVAGTPMLARHEWIPAAPIPLDQVTLSWRPGEHARDLAGPVPDGPVPDGPVPDGPLPDGPVPDGPVLDGTGAESAAVRPLRDDGSRFGCYADALGALSRPRLFENRTCYRLLDVRASAGAASLVFGPGRYFEMINTGEAAAHEFAAMSLAHPSPAPEEARGHRPHRLAAGDLPLRSLIGDPTDLRRRPVMAAIAALVLRADRDSGDVQMILHWRDPALVATGGGLYQVAPVGMFQPSHDAAWNLSHDFSLWRSIVRELSEELLGADEDYHSDAAPIDYQRWPLYTALADARRNGTLRVHWLGLGMDPLTLVVDMLSVAVFDAAFFDAVFAGLVSANEEGRIVTGEDPTGAAVGIPFSAASVERFTAAEPMQAAGAALLRTAWRHRDTLLGR